MNNQEFLQEKVDILNKKFGLSFTVEFKGNKSYKLTCDNNIRLYGDFIRCDGILAGIYTALDKLV